MIMTIKFSTYTIGYKNPSRKITKENYYFPSGRNNLEIARNLFESRRFPNCVGAIDGTNKPIIGILFD